MKTRCNTRTEMGARRLTSILVLIAFLGGHAWCATAPSGGAEEQVRAQPMSYIASLTGDKVFIRSGPGTHFYDCGKLNRGDTVEVWGTEKGWSKITPPALSLHFPPILDLYGLLRAGPLRITSQSRRRGQGHHYPAIVLRRT